MYYDTAPFCYLFLSPFQLASIIVTFIVSAV